MTSLFSKRSETSSEITVPVQAESLPFETLKETEPSVINVSLLSESLKRAAYHGNNEVVEELLMRRQIPDDTIRESLLIAVESNHPDTVSILLNYATLPDDTMYSLLRKVVRTGNTRLVKAIVSSKKCTPSIITSDVLSIACEGGMIDIVELLLSKFSGSVNEPLHICVSKGHWDLHDIILSHIGLAVIR